MTPVNRPVEAHVVPKAQIKCFGGGGTQVEFHQWIEYSSDI